MPHWHRTALRGVVQDNKKTGLAHTHSSSGERFYMAVNVLRSASALAILFGLHGFHFAEAQQSTQTVPTTTATQEAGQQAGAVDRTATPQQPDATDRVFITGSLISTTPEDAPRPVDVFTTEDLKQQGAPNVTEFLRSLTTSYGDDLGFGQASPDVPQGTGFGNANLRGLGSNGTLVLMNGKNLAPWNGSYGADVNTVPMAALKSVDILKDGASATYGAGAVGGVINFQTRRDIDAPQISIENNSTTGQTATTNWTS